MYTIFFKNNRLKKEIEMETRNKENASVNNAELERSVRAMEKNVMQLESGNLEADDSEIKQKFDNQRQLNVQLQEQKRWLEHELEQVRFFPYFIVCQNHPFMNSITIQRRPILKLNKFFDTLLKRIILVLLIQSSKWITILYLYIIHSAIFQIKLKIQNEKLNPLPDPFALDWDNLSETEMKRLVGQLEKTKADLLVMKR